MDCKNKNKKKNLGYYNPVFPDGGFGGVSG